MNLIRDNFDELYPELEKAINECDFCAIDGEFTGVIPYRDLNAFDTPKSRYDKTKKNSDNYLLLQFGLCIFKKLENSDYEALAYNCYLFPKSSEKSKYCKNVIFSCLSSSIEFLSGQNFDFNKVFSKGITYISKDHEEFLRERITQDIEAAASNNNNNKSKPIAYPYNKKELKDEITNIMTDIETFMENNDENEKEIKLTDYLVRKFTEKNLRNKYSGKMKYESKAGENKEHIMKIRKIKKDEVHSDILELEKEIGFSKLIWFLSKSNKPIVGHNIITDLLLTLRHFFGPLPNQYDDFKLMAHTIFPNIIDTKYMATIPVLKDLIQQTSLGDLNTILSEEPFKPVNIVNCKYDLDCDKLHEAGFDAFLTGYCYIRMLNYLESVNTNKQQSVVDLVKNKLHLMKSYDVTYIDLVNNQEMPNRDNVFYVEFPPFWDDQDLFNLFEPYGKIFIAWINKTSAFIALKTVENLKKINSQLVGVCGREYRIYFYNTYMNQLSKKMNNDNENLNKKRKHENDDDVQLMKNEQQKQNNNLNGNKYAILADLDQQNENLNKKNKIINIEKKNMKENNKKSLPEADKLFDECDDWNMDQE